MGDDFSDAFNRIENFMKDLNVESVDKENVTPEENDQDGVESEEGESGQLLRVFPENMEGPIYEVVGYPSDRFFNVRCTYSLVGAIAQQLTEDTADDILAEHHVEYEEQYFERFVSEPTDDDLHRVAAAIAWLESLDPDDIDQIVYSLSETFASAPIKNRIHSTPSGEGIIGFYVHQKIFPYEPDFTIRIFDETVEQVRLPAHLGQLYLELTFNLGINDAREETEREFSREVSTQDGL